MGEGIPCIRDLFQWASRPRPRLPLQFPRRLNILKRLLLPLAARLWCLFWRRNQLPRMFSRRKSRDRKRREQLAIISVLENK